MTARLLALASISMMALAASPAFAQTTPAPADPAAAPTAPPAVDPAAAEQALAIQKALTDGDTATKAKDYDGALAAYATGLAAAPEHQGAIYLHRLSASALRSKAVDTFNASAKTDADLKVVSGLMLKSVDESLKSTTLATTQGRAEDAKTAAAGLRETMRIMQQLAMLDDMTETQVAGASKLADEWLATSPTPVDISKFAIPVAWALFYKKQADSLTFLDKIEPMMGTEASSALQYYSIVRTVEKPGARKAKADVLLKAALAASTNEDEKKALKKALGI